MRINNNITAMNTHRAYSTNNTNVSKSVAKLSSGYKINSAADDAAGLAISEKMRAQIRGLEMASKNSQDGISMVQTAEGALQTTHDILQRMREIAVQSASDTNETSIDRSALDQEFQELINEINDTADKTKFNDMGLIDGTYASETTAASSLSSSVKTAWASSKVAADSYNVVLKAVLSTAEVTGVDATVAAGSADTLNGLTTVAGVSNLTVLHTAAVGTETATANGTWTFGYNADTQLFSMTNAGTGEVLTAGAEAIASGGTVTLDFGKAGTIALTDTAGAGGVAVGSFTSAANISSVGLEGGVTAADAEYRMTASVNGETINVEAGMDTLVFGNSGISVKLSGAISFDSTTGNINGNGAASSITMGIDVAKTKGKDFVLQTGANQGDQLAINIDRMDAKTLGVGSAGVGNRLNASAAVSQVNTAINLVSTQRSQLGALQNRLEFKIQNLDVSAENLTSAESRIRDVDMAKEMTEFTKQNILSQASTAMLAQANSLPQGVLQLLG